MLERSLLVETRDRRRYLVPLDVLRPAKAIQKLIDYDDEDIDCEPCFLPGVKSETFERVLDWCQLRKDVSEPEGDQQKPRGRLSKLPRLSRDELLLLDLPTHELEQLAKAAENLGIQSLQIYAEQMLRCR